jgi:hypothetical protein
MSKYCFVNWSKALMRGKVMEKFEKTRKVIGLSAAAAVSLSATAIVLAQDVPAPKGHVKVVQSALRDGASVGSADVNSGDKVRLAGGRYDR